MNKDEELIKLKNEIKDLKEKSKRKCDALKKSNEKIKLVAERFARSNRWSHMNGTEIGILRQITSNIDKYIYEVSYQYDNKIYKESQVSSYGTKWLKECLSYHLADLHQLIIYPYQIEIINAKKLW